MKKSIDIIFSGKGKLILTLLLVLVEVPASAESSPLSGTDFVHWFSIGIALFLILVIVFLLYVLNIFLKHVQEEKRATIPVEEIERAKAKKAAALQQEEKLLSHHEYDGIRELDNNLPTWWVYMFYATIVFSCVYLFHYHFSNGNLQTAEYDKEIEAASVIKKKSGGPAINEDNVTLVTDAAKIENGKSTYSLSCAPCHGKLGEGGVGPNLTDPYWKHGGGIKNIFKTIKKGVPEMGMISWEKQLRPEQIQEIASYILSIQGTNPPNGKAPEGELYKDEGK